MITEKELIRRALLGDKQAQEECTALLAGGLLPLTTGLTILATIYTKTSVR